MDAAVAGGCAISRKADATAIVDVLASVIDDVGREVRCISGRK
jgi:hypothetical protein